MVVIFYNYFLFSEESFMFSVSSI